MSQETKPAVTVDNTRIKCDEQGCDWQENIPFQDVLKWHNRCCPECGTGVIVRGVDMVVWGQIQSLIDLGMTVPAETKLATTTIDTADLRANASISHGD